MTLEIVGCLVDVDNKETLCDDSSGLRACSHER